MALYPKQLPRAYEARDLMAEGLISVSAAAEFLDVCDQTIYNLMDAGTLPFVIMKGFRGRRIPKTALRILAEGP